MKARFSFLFFFLFLFSVFSTQYCAPLSQQEKPQESQKESFLEKLHEPDRENTDEIAPERKPEATVEIATESRPEATAEIALEPASEPTAEPQAELPPPDAEPTLEPPLPDLFPEMTAEATVPLPGFGAITGECGELDDTEWNSSNSFLFRNTIDLGNTGFDETKLTAGGQKLWRDGNLGGSSVHSEILAYEILQRCELALLLKSEVEILYTNHSGKKTDILVEIDTRKVGVSVTRAYNYPPTQPYTLAKATSLLQSKLGDIPLSAANAAPQDAWVRSILSIIAYNQQHADTVEQAYHQLDAQLKGNTILILTVTDGKDDYVY